MNIFEKIAESRITEAMQNGEFEDLPYKGRPIDLKGYFSLPGHLRAAYGLLRNANVLPTEIQLMKEIEQLQNRLDNERDTSRRDKLSHQIQFKQIELRIIMEKPGNTGKRGEK